MTGAEFYSNYECIKMGTSIITKGGLEIKIKNKKVVWIRDVSN